MSAGILESGTLAGVHAFLLMVRILKSRQMHPGMLQCDREIIFRKETDLILDTT